MIYELYVKPRLSTLLVFKPSTLLLGIEAPSLGLLFGEPRAPSTSCQVSDPSPAPGRIKSGSSNFSWSSKTHMACSVHVHNISC